MGLPLALKGVGEIIVTVPAAAGRRPRVYRIRFGNGETEQEPSPDCLRGDSGVRFSLVVYEGGSVEDLEACARSLHVTALYTLDDGASVSLILGAPEFVNRPFRELFLDGLLPATPLVVGGSARRSPRAGAARGYCPSS